jgi:hypothetical protein
MQNKNLHGDPLRSILPSTLRYAEGEEPEEKYYSRRQVRARKLCPNGQKPSRINLK